MGSLLSGFTNLYLPFLLDSTLTFPLSFVETVFIPVCSISIGLRLYARRTKGVGLGVDDWLILGVLVSSFQEKYQLFLFV